jgi:hypothetical protein
MRHFVTATLLLSAAAPFFQLGAATGDHPNPAQQPPVAVKFLGLFDRLREAQEKNTQGEHQTVSFQLSETEINDYLRYSLKTTPRPGVDSVTIKVFAKDYISTLTRVDFDTVERWHPGTIPTVLRPILKGKKAITMDFRIHAEGSQMTFSVEKARYEDMTLSPFLAEKLIQIVAARQPEKYDTNKPLPLPFGLQKVWTSEHTIQGTN